MLFVAFTTTLKVFNSYQPTSNFEIKDKLKRTTRLTGSDSKRCRCCGIGVRGTSFGGPCLTRRRCKLNFRRLHPDRCRSLSRCL